LAQPKDLGESDGWANLFLASALSRSFTTGTAISWSLFPHT
jgi:hypothetical protein